MRDTIRTVRSLVLGRNRQLFEARALALQYHKELNPVVWENATLRDDVRQALLAIASRWRDFAHIPASAVKDVILTGGNANYNYTPQSDLDVHLVVDKGGFPVAKGDFLDDYLRDKKLLWARSHGAISVKGYPVELYAQGIDEQLVAAGVYSLSTNSWISTPQHHDEYDFVNDPHLVRKSDILMDHIDSLLADGKEEDFEAMKEKLAGMRKSGLAKAGEFSFENLIFKNLRNQGYLDKVSDKLRDLEDERLSLR